MITVKLMNIQGLTQVKASEVEEILHERCVICLTETQQRRDTIRFKNSTRSIAKMREHNDKKGGGLCLLWGVDGGVEVERLETKHSDLMMANIVLEMMEFTIILVYFSTGSGARERNDSLEREVRQAIDERSKEKNSIVLAGDFNGHVGFMGSQSLNENGERILRLIEECDMRMLNMEENCFGKNTWERGDQSSIIDFILCNDIMYGRFCTMDVDEEREILDCSDHCLLSAEFRCNKKRVQPRYMWETIEYYRINDENLELFKNRMEEDLSSRENVSAEALDILVDEAAEKTMRVKYMRKIDERTGKCADPLWFSEEIRREISKRRCYNKLKRREINMSEKERYERLYYEQKRKVQLMVRDAIDTYEGKITRKIINDPDRSKNLWKHIRELQGEIYDRQRKIKLFDEDGNELPSSMIPQFMKEFWTTIYQNRENGILQVWNNEVRQTYEELWMEEDNNELEGLMSKVNIEKHDIVRQLKKTKKGKAPGPDGLKPDFYVEMVKSEICLNALVKAFRHIVENADIPTKWKGSKTIMIQKKKKPTVKDLRPIALMNSSYKLLMGIIRVKIEEHLRLNSLVSDLQSGSTCQRRATDNLFILRHCVESAYREKKPLYVVSIDFKKAFDSIDRGKMISILMEYKVEPWIISMIANVYVGDETEIYLNNEKLVDLQIKSGIRQGCNVSMTLFVMITYHIIGKMQESMRGFRAGDRKINCLFYVDDGLLLADSKIGIEDAVDNLKLVAGTCGLEVNTGKV